MIWSGQPGRAKPPCVLRKKHRENGKKYARNLVPERFESRGKGLPESASKTASSSSNVANDLFMGQIARLSSYR